jgi:tetratricopeptide (TPR) repeat protein
MEGMNARAGSQACVWCLIGTTAIAAPLTPPRAGIQAVRQAALIPDAAKPPSTPSPRPPPQDGENAPDDSLPLPIPPVAPRIAEGDQYDRCMDLLADDPAGADALAVAWKGGGEAAMQCRALAQVELGNPASGAALLTGLASASAAEPSARAEVFGQAAQAWTMAGNAAKAYETATQAIALSPDDPELRVTHAIAAASVRRDREAIDDLTAVLAGDPKRADALTLRATAYRRLGDLARAQTDIGLACAQDGENADALLERGIIRQLLGDRGGARQDWQKVMELAADTPAGDLAQQDLALLDAGPAQ